MADQKTPDVNETLAAMARKIEELEKALQKTGPSRKQLDEEAVAAIQECRSKVLARARAQKLTTAARAAWVKIYREGFERPRMDFTREGRVHCIGFRVDGVTEVSEAEAKKSHLGFVRGYVDYTDPKFFEVVDRMMGYIVQNAK